jgi:ubiquinone/menaquinone biosynthesis C-methylase UbiE
MPASELAPNGGDAVDHSVTFDSVKDYYGKVLAKSSDLKTNACCTAEKLPDRVKAALAKVHEDVLAKYYGCGIVAPDELRGKRVLDLGCGSGRDVYVLAQFVGEEGESIGVDMTDAQLEVARETEEWHRAKFGFAKKNTRFLTGYIERLDELELEPASFDVIVSNCVLNLSPDKPAVLAQLFKLLKDGGEFFFSDVYASRRVPKALREDEVLWGECISGALYWNDFERLSQRLGFTDPRLVKVAPITVNNKELEQKVSHIQFASATYRLFKLPGLLEPDCEDYGQAVIYKGTIESAPEAWALDDHHTMQKGKVFPVCGNTWHMLYSTRFRDHFDFIGNFDTHYGIYEGCGRGSKLFAEPGAAACAPGGSCC